MDSYTALYMEAIWVIVVKMQLEIPHLKITFLYRIWLPIPITSGPIFRMQALNPVFCLESFFPIAFY